jgi:hypothetical protein
MSLDTVKSVPISLGQDDCSLIESGVHAWMCNDDPSSLFSSPGVSRLGPWIQQTIFPFLISPLQGAILLHHIPFVPTIPTIFPCYDASLDCLYNVKLSPIHFCVMSIRRIHPATAI